MATKGHVLIRIPAEVREDLRRIAAADQRTMSTTVRRALAAYEALI